MENKSKKNEVWMAGYNEKGMEKAGKDLAKIICGLGILFGFFMMIFSVGLGIVIIIISVIFLINVKNKEKQDKKPKSKK